MPTPARREISAIGTSASRSANAARATVMILSRLRSASARLTGDRGWLSGIVIQVDGPKWTGYPVALKVNRTGYPPADASDGIAPAAAGPRPRKEGASMEYRPL